MSGPQHNDGLGSQRLHSHVRLVVLHDSTRRARPPRGDVRYAPAGIIATSDTRTAPPDVPLCPQQARHAQAPCATLSSHWRIAAGAGAVADSDSTCEAFGLRPADSASLQPMCCQSTGGAGEGGGDEHYMIDAACATASTFAVTRGPATMMCIGMSAEPWPRLVSAWRRRLGCCCFSPPRALVF